MTDRRKLIIAAICFALLIIAAALLYGFLSGGGSQPDGKTTAVKAPDFEMLDRDGNTVSLSEHLGKPVVLNFWASWCVICKNEMPAFDALHTEYGDKVDFIMLNQTDGMRETVEIASDFIDKQDYGFPIYFDTQMNGTFAYSVRGIPTTFFIGADGMIRAYSSGAVSEESLRRVIEDMLE